MSQLFMKVVPPSNNKKRKLSEIEQVEPPRKRAKTDKFNTNEHFQKWSKDISRFAKKSHAAASFVDIIVPDFLEEKMFEKLFEGKGHKIQPTPDNKPTSVVTIINFDTWESIQKLFGYGNIVQTGYEVPAVARAPLQKSENNASVKVCIQSLEVQYNKMKKKLDLTFRCNKL